MQLQHMIPRQRRQINIPRCGRINPDNLLDLRRRSDHGIRVHPEDFRLHKAIRFIGVRRRG